MLAIVFESLVDFFFFFEKFFVPVRGFLSYTVAYRGLHTQVSLLDSRVQYASCHYAQSCTNLEIGIFRLGFFCPCLFVILICQLVFLINTVLLV